VRRSARESALPNQLVAFRLDDQTYALRLASVHRVLRMVEVTPLPHAPEVVVGVINVGGEIVPALDVRRRFRLRPYEPSLDSHLILARTANRTVSLPVDSVVGLVERSDSEITEADVIVPGTAYVEGVAKLDDGLLFIHDLDRFLSLEEERQLADLLSNERRIAE
jgi:purine-binding chemotaxis protein CheW